MLTELIVTQAVDQLQETVVPYAMYKWRKLSISTVDHSESVSQTKLASHQIDKEAKKDVYEVRIVGILGRSLLSIPAIKIILLIVQL